MHGQEKLSAALPKHSSLPVSAVARSTHYAKGQGRLFRVKQLHGSPVTQSRAAQSWVPQSRPPGASEGRSRTKDTPVPLGSPASLLVREQEAFIIANQMSSAKRALHLVHRLRFSRERDFPVLHEGPESV